MPLMEYACQKCSHQFEILVGVSKDAEKAVCPECGSKKVEKLFSAFAAHATASAGASPAPAPSKGHSCGAGCGCFN